MITFPCKCGNILEVPSDQAGGLIQCDRCGLLADVPRSDDLANLQEDGTFVFEDASPIDDGMELADLHRTFTNERVDENGHQKDLRPTADHFERIGVIDEAPPRVTPRYDPFTGELIRPLQFKDETPMPVLAIAVPADQAELSPEIPAAAALTYAAGDIRTTPNFVTVAMAMFQPANTIVMFFMFFFYVAAYLAKIPLNTFALYFHLPTAIALVPNIFLWLIVAHYGCVVEDTGPDAIDEIPRPMRFMDFRDDLFGPLFKFLRAIAICFFPAMIAAHLTDFWTTSGSALVLACVGVGSIFFPAVLLTSLTGTTFLNLGPIRILSVIGICGGEYILSVFLGIVSLALTAILTIGPVTLPPLAAIPGIQNADRILLLFPGTILAMYVSHLFCWHLGLLYREHHEEFPWMAQRHVRMPKAWDLKNY